VAFGGEASSEDADVAREGGGSVTTDADISGVRAATPQTACACECLCCDCCSEAHLARLDAIRARTERDEAHALLRHYEDSAAEESRVDLVVVVLSLIGAATVLVALVCLVVLALRLAGGAA